MSSEERLHEVVTRMRAESHRRAFERISGAAAYDECADWLEAELSAVEEHNVPQSIIFSSQQDKDKHLSKVENFLSETRDGAHEVGEEEEGERE